MNTASRLRVAVITATETSPAPLNTASLMAVALGPVALDALGDDDRVVHHQADRHRDGEQRHHVEAEVEQPEDDDGPGDGDGDGQHHAEGRASRPTNSSTINATASTASEVSRMVSNTEFSTNTVVSRTTVSSKPSGNSSLGERAFELRAVATELAPEALRTSRMTTGSPLRRVKVLGSLALSRTVATSRTRVP